MWLCKARRESSADGEIIKGSGNFNESHITGESQPVNKIVGSAVVAGAMY